MNVARMPYANIGSHTTPGTQAESSSESQPSQFSTTDPPWYKQANQHEGNPLEAQWAAARECKLTLRKAVLPT